jgi:hydroxyacylglutathione hydrolase
MGNIFFQAVLPQYRTFAMHVEPPLEQDWYRVEALGKNIFAIGEPLYAQQNWSYLFVGETRALLFDTGSYHGDITPVVQRRVSGPLTVLPSHMHYDHLGNVTRFDHVVVADLEIMRACATDDRLTPSDVLFLGESENRTPPEFLVREWIEMDSEIDLGRLRLRVVHTPGHSPDSISLWFAEQNLLFTADFLYPGSLYGQTPGTNLAAYLATAKRLRGIIYNDTTIYAAHGNAGPEDAHTAPKLDAGQITALISCLETIPANPPEFGGSNVCSIPVSTEMELLVSPDALKGFS